MKTKQAKQQPETVGRTFGRTRYEIHYRRVEDPKWRRSVSTYETLEEASAALAQTGKRYVAVGGGLSIDLGPSVDLFEYRIVKAVSNLEVLHVELKKI